MRGRPTNYSAIILDLTALADCPMKLPSSDVSDSQPPVNGAAARRV